jgi:transposase
MPRPNKYPPEFRRDVAELVRSSGKTIAQVAKELGLNRETVRCWVRRDQADRGERSDLLSTAERRELAPAAAGGRRATDGAGDAQGGRGVFRQGDD